MYVIEYKAALNHTSCQLAAMEEVEVASSPSKKHRNKTNNAQKNLTSNVG